MSCIPKLLAAKEQSKLEYFSGFHSIIEGGGKYLDKDYIITFNDLGFRCGYVAVPRSHPVLPKDLNDYAEMVLDVHGGVTFCAGPLFQYLIPDEPVCDDVWIGFDCGHACDGHDLELARKIWPMNLFSPPFRNLIFDLIKDYEYVEVQCQQLIDQLVVIEKLGLQEDDARSQ